MKSARLTLHYNIVIVSILFFLFFYYIHWKNGLLTLQGMINWGDSGIFFTKPEYAYESFLFVWQQNLDTYGASSTSILFSGILTTLCKGNAALAQRIWLLSPHFLMALGMFLLLNNLLKSKVVTILSTFLYIFAPSAIYSFFQLSPTLFGYFAFPILTLLLLKMMENHFKISWVVAFATILAILSMCFLQLPLLFFPLLVTFLVVHITLNYNFKYIIKIFLLMIIVALLFIILTLPQSYYYIEQLFKMVKMGSIYYGYQEISSERIVNAMKANFSSRWVIDNLWWYSFLTGFVISCSLLLVNSKERKEKALEFSLLASLTIIFWHLNTTGQLLCIFERFPFLALFEQFKLSLILTFTDTVLIALFADELSVKFTRKMLTTTTLICLFVIIMIGNLYHDFIPSYYNPSHPKSLDLIMGNKEWFSKGIVPEVYYEAAKWLEETDPSTNFKVMWLPMDPFQYIVLTSCFVRTPIYWPENSTAAENFLIHFLIYSKTERLGELLNTVGVKYVFVNLDANSYGIFKHEGAPNLLSWGNRRYPVGDPKQFIELLNKQKDLKLLNTGKKTFLVYWNIAFRGFIQLFEGILAFKTSNNSSDIIKLIGRNILINGDFSLGTEHWVINSPKFLIEKINGTYALKFSRNDVKAKSWSLATQYIDVEGDAEYLIQGSVKTYNVNTSSIKVTFYNKNGEDICSYYLIGARNEAKEWQSTHVSGTNDWFEFSGIIHAPVNAVKASISLMGGWALDPTRSAETWFSNISIRKYKEWKIPQDEQSQYAKLFESLQMIPFLRNKLVVQFADEIKELKLIHGYVSLGSNYMFNLSNGYFVYNLAGSPPIRTIELKFQVQNTNKYKLVIVASTSSEAFIHIQNYTQTIIPLKSDGLFLYETKYFTSSIGVNSIKIDFNQDTILKVVVITGAHMPILPLEEPFTNPICNKVSSTRYDITINISKPAILIFKSKYNSGWELISPNGQKLNDLLVKIPCLYYETNSFLLNETSGTFTLIFKPQKTREVLLTFWMLSWFSFIMIGCTFILIQRKHKNKYGL